MHGLGPMNTVLQWFSTITLILGVFFYSYAGILPRWLGNVVSPPELPPHPAIMSALGTAIRYRVPGWEMESLRSDQLPNSVDQAARETGVSPTLLLSTVAILGFCNAVDCYVRYSPVQTDASSSPLTVPIIGFARALSASSNAATSEREDIIGLEALLWGPKATRSAISKARQNGSRAPDFFQEHQPHLPSAGIESSMGTLNKILSLSRLRSLMWPLDQYRGISSAFGPRIHPVKGKIHHHNGIDLRAPRGTLVKAVQSGIITTAAENPFNGKFIKIDHGLGIESLYCHLSAIQVATGDYVESYQPIGKVGQTGRVTGPHLHYTLKIDGMPVDPLHYGLSQNPPSPHLPVVLPAPIRPNS